MRRSFINNLKEDGFRINHQIRSPMVRVILENNNLGVVSFRDALNLATERGLDLIEVNKDSKPPVCRIADYSKMQYEMKKKEKQKNQHHNDLKEINLTPVIAQHDIDTKIKQLVEFLKHGKKVKVSVGNKNKKKPMIHIEEGKRILNMVIEATKDIGKYDKLPFMEGNRLVVSLTPLVTK